MRQALLFTFLFIIPIFSFAQKDCPCSHQCNCIVSGIVTDIETGEPLPFANIHVVDDAQGVSANEAGQFSLDNICQCDLVLEVSYTGYKPKKINVHTDHAEFLKVLLAQDTRLLESVVILGKSSSTAFESQHTQSINSDIIEAQTGNSLGEALSGSISGMSMIQTGGNITKPVIQGLNANRILILNNGIRYEGQQWGAEHAPAIDPLIADKIEVIKGAASVKYGSGALGGVILVLPAELPTQKEVSGRINFSGQSNGGLFTTSAMMESALNNHWSWRAQGTFKKGGDLKTPDYHLTNTGVKELNFSGTLGKKYEHATYELFFSHFNTELGILKTVGLINNLDDFIHAVNSDIPPGTEEFSYQINAPKQNSDHSLAKLKANWELSENELHLQYGLQVNHRNEFDIRRGNLINIPSMDLKLTTHNLDLDFELRSHKKHQLNLGFNTIYQENKNIPGTQTIPYIPNYNSISAGFFAIERYSLRKITFELGGRTDLQTFDVAGRDFKNDPFRANYNFLNLSGIAGLRYTPNQQNVLMFNVSTGWRPPHVSELYSFGTHQSAAAIEYGLLLDENNEVINSEDIDLKSEGSLKAVVTYELHGDKLHFDASGYYQTINNFFFLKSSGVTTTTRGTFPTFRYHQTKALFTGLDLDMQYDFSRHLSLSMLYSLLYSKDLTNNDFFLYIPANRLNLGINWHIENFRAFEHIDIFIDGKYTFEQSNAPASIDLDNPDFNFPENGRNYDFIPAPPAYFLLDAGASLHKKWGKNTLEFLLKCTNLFNTNYTNNTNRLKYFANEKGQNVKIGIIFHF